MCKAIAYTRVSSEEQAQSGLSLNDQAARTSAFCLAKGWELVGVVEDAGESAATTKRPGLREVMRRCRADEVQAVVVLKLDRLTRNVRDLGDLLEFFEKCGVAFSSVTDNFDTSTANGRLVLNLLGSVAQWERDVCAERTRDALAVKKCRGERVGAVPYGFALADNGMDLIPIRRELAVVRWVQRARESGQSLRAIAGRLNAKGIPTKRGRQWGSSTIYYMLGNNLYSEAKDR